MVFGPRDAFIFYPAERRLYLPVICHRKTNHNPPVDRIIARSAKFAIAFFLRPYALRFVSTFIPLFFHTKIQ